MLNRTPARSDWARTPIKRRLPGADPYLAGKAGPRSVCPECGLLYRDKRWALERREKPRKGEPAVPAVLCPACRKTRDGVYAGEVLLSGAFLPAHKKEVEAVILHEEARAMEKNPLERIVVSRWEGEGLLIRTTVKKLAQRLGRALHGSFKGRLMVKPGQGGTPTRVWWSR